jgi:hypothetical protein
VVVGGSVVVVAYDGSGSDGSVGLSSTRAVQATSVEIVTTKPAITL